MYIQNGIIYEGNPPGDLLSAPVDYTITLGTEGRSPVDEDPQGAPVPGLQADAPYTSADQVLIAGAGETPLTADVPYNMSDQAMPTGFNSGAAGATKDGGGIGEWVTNGFKSLANGFLGGMTQQNRNATAVQPGGAYGASGPGWLGRFGTATAPLPGHVATAGSGITSSGITWLVILGLAFVLIMSIRSR